MIKILKNIVIIIVGIIIGMIINIGIIVLGGMIFPVSDSFNPMNALNWDFKYFIFPFLAHSIGTFTGVLIASKLSKRDSIMIPAIVGLYFLLGGIYMVTILPAPTWFVLLDITLCYIPMSLLGWKFSN